MGPDCTLVVLQPSPQEGMGIFVSTRQSDPVVSVLHMQEGHVIKFCTALQMLVVEPQIAACI